MDIDKAFDILMEFEGGDAVVSIPADNGGLTKYGISQAAYPALDIANLTADTAKAIYATDYWLKASCAKLKPDLQYLHFDTAVNMGVDTAIKLLQQAAGCNVDGMFGAETLTKSDNVSAAAYLFFRECSYAKIAAHRTDQIKFLGGWTNRNMNIYSMGLKGQL